MPSTEPVKSVLLPKRPSDPEAPQWQNHLASEQHTSVHPRTLQSEQAILLNNCEGELQEVSGYEHERHQTSEGRIQLTTHHPSGRQLPNPSLVQTDEDEHFMFARTPNTTRTSPRC